MAHYGHHDDHAGAEAAGAASWLVAMVIFVVLAVALIVALFVWAPWDDDTVGGGTGDVPGVEEGEGGSDVDIEGDIDVSDGDAPEAAPEGE